MSVREIANVETPFYRACKRRGWWCAKWVPTSKRGVPDRMVLMPGGVVEFVELKAPGKKPSEQQLRRHKELRALGFTVTVLDSPEDVAAWAAQ